MNKIIDRTLELAVEPKYLEAEKSGDLSFAGMIADVISGDFNQSSSVIFTGRTGSGKSMAAIRLAYNVSVRVAEKLGTNPDDHFNINNIAVISNNEVIRMLGLMRKNGIYILDDIGVSWSSRDWQSKVNKIMNKIFQTIRTENSLIITTIPSSFMLDKVPRALSHYFIEMQMQMFEKQLTVGKVFQIKNQGRSGQIYYPYVQDKGKKYIRAVFRLPPDHIRSQYEIKRTEIAHQLKVESLEELAEEMNISPNLESAIDGAITRVHNKKLNKKDAYIMLQKEIDNGKYEDIYDAAKNNPDMIENVSPDYYNQVIKNYRKNEELKAQRIERLQQQSESKKQEQET